MWAQSGLCNRAHRRAATIKKIEDPTLQAQAKERLDVSQKSFAGVLDSLRVARESFDPLRKELADHIKYLESDLSPSGTASLKPHAEGQGRRRHRVCQRRPGHPRCEHLLHRFAGALRGSPGSGPQQWHRRREAAGGSADTLCFAIFRTSAIDLRRRCYCRPYAGCWSFLGRNIGDGQLVLPALTPAVSRATCQPSATRPARLRPFGSLSGGVVVGWVFLRERRYT